MYSHKYLLSLILNFSGSGDEKDKKKSNMRRNIRDVMDETQLDEATLAAQRQEMERLQRVQEQQRILREVCIQCWNVLDV